MRLDAAEIVIFLPRKSVKKASRSCDAWLVGWVGERDGWHGS